MDFNKLVSECEDRLPELTSMPLGDYLDWLEENEQMYGYFVKFAKEAIEADREHFSAYMIRERVRWYVHIEYKGEYKISNNLTPYIARTLVIELPELEHLFSFKGEIIDGRWADAQE